MSGIMGNATPRNPASELDVTAINVWESIPDADGSWEHAIHVAVHSAKRLIIFEIMSGI